MFDIYIFFWYYVIMLVEGFMYKTHKLHFLFAFVSLLLFLGVVSCDTSSVSTSRVAVKAVRFEKESYRLTAKQSLNLSEYITVAPADATNKKVEFVLVDSEDRTYVDLNNLTGELTAKTKTPDSKYVRVKVVSKENKKISSYCDIAIDGIKVSKIEVYATEEDTIMNVNDIRTLKVKVFPEDADNKTLRYISNNTNVIKVNEQTGLLEAKARGNAKITILANDKSSTYATIDMAVDDTYVYCTGFEFPTNLNTQGYSVALNATIPLPNKTPGDVVLLPKGSAGELATTTQSFSISFSDAQYFRDLNLDEMTVKAVKATGEEKVYIILRANDARSVETRIPVSII